MNVIKNNDTAEHSCKPAPFPPEFLEKYEPLECFSHNEISETFLIKSLESGEKFIAKVYESYFVTEGADERVILSELDHPAVPKLIESFETDEVVCIVRSYAEGSALDTVGLPVGEQFVLNVGVQLCDIMSHLHTRTPPIIHRDIKPQNVIIDGAGNVSLVDFGIARRYKEAAEKDTRFVASDGFSPPEQYGFGQTDSLTDIYSLGRLLCWLLTGSNDITEAGSIQNRELARVIKKCAEFAPKDRYKNAEAVKAALIKACKRKTRRIFTTSAITVLLITFGFILGRVTHPAGFGVPIREIEFETVQPPVYEPGESVIFKEPLIEQAVRLSLGKAQDEPISREELDDVAKIYIIGNTAAATHEDFGNLIGAYWNGEIPFGRLECLSDLYAMKNLQEFGIFAQPLSDISPLSISKNLQRVEIHNCNITDISSLYAIPRIKILVLRGNLITDLPSFEKMESMQNLIIDSVPIKNISQLGYMPQLQYLELPYTPLESLDGIETMQQLHILRIENTFITDFSPLNNLSRLQRLYINADMEQYLSTLNREDIEVIIS